MIEVTDFNDVKNITTDEYFKNNEFAVDMFNAKYSHIKNDGNKQNPSEVFYRVANGLSQFENNYDHYISQWFSIMYNNWFRPGGSILSGVDSGRKESLANCTTLPVEGDTLEDISKTYHSLMKCAAYRQGMGVDLSNLRPRGSKVGNAAEESMGIVPWGKMFSGVGSYVGQRGRMPALLESLKVSHPDIEEFITSKTKSGEIEFANISVQITNDFIDYLKNDKPWKLKFIAKDEIIEKDIDPKYLINLISETAAQSAEPGVQFIDLMKDGSMVDVVYKVTGDKRFEIISTNACLVGDTLVDTDKGQVEIQDLVKDIENYKVLTYNEESKELEYENITFGDKTRVQDNIIEIELDDGEMLELTPDHKVYTENRGYVEAAQLEDTDIIYFLE